MFLNDDDMVDCPYNKSHRMLRKRLQSHLLKCRLNYPHVELRKCPFNITHLIPEPEFTYHATNCPDRKLIAQYKYNAPEQKEEDGPKHAPIECDEDWDDTDVTDYNPQLYVEKANVIRKPEGCNPSCRKIFIKEERKRLGDGDDDDIDTINNVIIPSSPLNVKQERNHSDEDGDDVIPNVKKPLENRFKYDTTAYSSRSDWNSASSSSMGSSRNKRSEIPAASYSKGRSRSPNRDRSRSPGYRPYRDRSPLRVSPDYSRRYSPPNFGRSTLDAYNPDKDPYYNSGNSSNNGDAYYHEKRHGYGSYCTSESSSIPREPPPPMISYPAPRSHLTTRYPSSK